jgi:hypothetical protein
MVDPSRTNDRGLQAIDDDKTVHHAKQNYRAILKSTARFDFLPTIVDVATHQRGSRYPP